LPQKYEAIKLDNRRTKKLVLYPLPVSTLISKGRKSRRVRCKKDKISSYMRKYTNIKSYRRRKFFHSIPSKFLFPF
jgi:hypothetical protein